MVEEKVRNRGRTVNTIMHNNVMRVTLQFDPSGTLTTVSLNARNEREQDALEKALSRVLRPKYGEMVRRWLKRLIVPAYCRGLILKGVAQRIHDLFHLKGL